MSCAAWKSCSPRAKPLPDTALSRLEARLSELAGALGDSVARLLELAGHEVEREYYYNDAGRQMELFRASVEAIRRGEEPPEDGYRGEYVVELARKEGDPVPKMLEQIEASLERLRI